MERLQSILLEKVIGSWDLESSRIVEFSEDYKFSIVRVQHFIELLNSPQTLTGLGLTLGEGTESGRIGNSQKIIQLRISRNVIFLNIH